MRHPRPLATLVTALAVAVLATVATVPAAGAAPAAPAAPAASAASAAGTGLRADGPTLLLDGRPARLAGFNGYSLTTFWPVNWGCGQQIDDLDGTLAALGPGALVRTWAFQALAYDNKNAHRVDFTGIDRVVQAAERQGVLLELVLSDQAGTCDDGHWHDRAWYAGGYAQRYDDDGRGLTTMSYEKWVETVVSRYASSPAVAVWGPVNEPEAADCADGRAGGACYGHGVCPPDAATVLKGFYDRIGAVIHRLDPGSLVASGVIGGGQCGLAGGGYAEVHRSPGVDIATFHDYGAERTALPEELAQRLREAQELGKPLLVEEVGIGASDDPADQCATRVERAALHRSKRDAAFLHGADGYLPWWYEPHRPGGCSHALIPGDPVLDVLRTTTSRAPDDAPRRPTPAMRIGAPRLASPHVVPVAATAMAPSSLVKVTARAAHPVPGSAAAGLRPVTVGVFRTDDRGDLRATVTLPRGSTAVRLVVHGLAPGDVKSTTSALVVVPRAH